jgi:hypothetical protein
MKVNVSNSKVKTLKQMIMKSQGRFFTATTRKPDGTIRKWNARIDVQKGLNGTGRLWKDNNHQVTVYDMVAKGYRVIDCEKLTFFKCGKLVYGNKV